VQVGYDADFTQRLFENTGDTSLIISNLQIEASYVDYFSGDIVAIDPLDVFTFDNINELEGEYEPGEIFELEFNFSPNLFAAFYLDIIYYHNANEGDNLPESWSFCIGTTPEDDFDMSGNLDNRNIFSNRKYWKP